MSDASQDILVRGWGVGNWPKVDKWRKVLTSAEQKQYITAYNFVTTVERLNEVFGRTGPPVNINEWDEVVEKYNVELSTQPDGYRRYYEKTKSFQGAYSKYKRQLFDFMPDDENKEQGNKMERAGILKEERQKNNEFLRATQDAKNHQKPFEVAPGYVLEAGHIYPDLGYKYIRSVDSTKKREILEPEKMDRDDEGDSTLSELSDSTADENMKKIKKRKKKHKSTYVRVVVNKKRFDRPEFWKVLMVEWMGRWPNPIAEDDPFTPYYRIGLVTADELEEYEEQYDFISEFERINESLEDGFMSHEMDIDNERMKAIAEEFNSDSLALGYSPLEVEFYEESRLESMKHMVLFLSALSILPPELE